MIQEDTISVDTTGGDGVATGTGITPGGVAGRILAIRIDYNALTPATADVTITERKGSTDWQTIHTETDSATDVVRYPRTPVQDASETNVTYDGSNEIYESFVTTGQILVTVAQADALTAAVVVGILYEL